MKKPEKCGPVQMKLSDKEEWTGRISVLDGVAVSYAEQKQVGECRVGLERGKSLTANLMERISSLSNMERACRRVIKNKGSSGIDGMEVGELRDWFGKHWRDLQNDLEKGTYKPEGLREVLIPKPNGGERKLSIPTLKDRLVQQAINQELSKIYEKGFSPTSYGFRKGRSAGDALSQLSHYVKKGRSYIVDIDLSKFFDEVNHERLMSQLRKQIGDKRVLQLIHRFLRAGILRGGLVSQRIKGTAQGSPLSPLLSNIVLDELDKELSQRGHVYVRYADDIVIAVSSLRSAERVETSISTFIEKKLKLKVNRTKSKISKPLDLNYLGHRLLNNGTLLLSEVSEKRLKDKIRELTRRNRGISMESLIKELNMKLRGWLNYFKGAKMKARLRTIDSWLRRRLRCYRIKQRKRPLGIMRFLNKLGVPKHRAWTTAASRKGWWRKSLSPASCEGMNNKWFTKIGLISLTKTYSLLQT